MVTEFGFLPEEAKGHTTSARSFLAQPINSEGKMIGILYLFSMERQVFPSAAEPHELRAACNAIAAFLEGANFSEAPAT